MGFVKIEVIYNSPDVTASNGKDRSGKIWGGLIPYKMFKERWMEERGEATTDKPYRMGANENTLIKISHDVLVEDKKLKAGTYALFSIPGEKQWTIIFSKKIDSWGHYLYDPADDVLRVQVESTESPRQEWLNFEFTDRFLDRTTLVFSWDNIAVPIHFRVENIKQLYVDQIKSELESEKLNYWYDFLEGARFCLKNDVALELGLSWAEKAINQTWVGKANFETLKVKAGILRKLNRINEADSLMSFAIKYASGVFELHNYARELVHQKRIDEAIFAFDFNYKRFPDYWLANAGKARALALRDDYKSALKYAKKAKAMIPENEYQMRHDSIDRIIKSLESNQRPANYFYIGFEQDY